MLRPHLVLWIALAVSPLLGGCPDEGAQGDTDTSVTDTNPDTSPDLNEPDSDVGDSVGDTSDDSTDSDTSPGRTVAGTSLEGVDVVWDAPLTLCSVWNEGATLADEKARKVRLELSPQTRTTLDEDALAGTRIAGLELRTSPFATGAFQPGASTARVTSWQILESGGGSHFFSATVEHELPGKAGTFFESYALARAPGAPDDVVVGAATYEVTFSWQPFGGAVQPVRLERCGGDAGYEDAVSVVTGYAGTEWVTLLRYWRTTVGQVDAGSYPVELVGHRIVTSQSPWWPTDVRGFWAHTYVAQHHNWDDATEVDLAGDLGHWHHTLKHRAEGTSVVSKVSVEGLLSFGEGAIILERATDAGPVTTRFEVADARSFVRLDAAHLKRAHAERCAGVPPEVEVAGSSDHVVQVLFCGGARPAAVALIPVVWGSDPAFIGQEFAVVGSGSNEWSFEVGLRDVTVFARPDDYFELLILDDQGELVSQSYEPRGALWLPELRTSPVVSSAEVNGVQVSMEIGREWVTFGVGKSQIWAPTHFTVTLGEQTWTVESWDRMTYTNTHHNWEDELVAEADDGTELRWKTSFMNDKPNLLTITAADGTPILPETLLPEAPER